MKNFWSIKAWQARAGLVLISLWVLLLVIAVLQNLSIMIIGGLIVTIGYIIGLVWVCKAVVNNQEKSKSVHWLDLYIKRIVYSLVFLLVFGLILSLLLGLIVSLSVSVDYEIFGTGATYIFGAGVAEIYASYCLISLLIGWGLCGKFIKQNMIAEGNIKADEMYNGKKRKVGYWNKAKNRK